MVPFLAVIISMFILIHLWILHNTLPEFFCLGNYIYIFPLNNLLLHCAIVISVFVLIYMWIIYLCLNCHILVFHTIYSLCVLYLENFVLHLFCAWVILPLWCNYIYVCINIFVNIIYMFPAIDLYNLYNLLLSYTPYYEACHVYF